ncbi:hypothetical protein JS533_004375 [Bifidobacterium amazonense]|uniref:Transposase n=1 Tax=Bifidobacterium amazonense TaxID=2809027 RepID=A0ABS9VTT2_9BIFI|nr:hypothetical protein [Bifidobacterium amazonense]MCH9275513.1 hypothetical protein [Bifidobacterium amazonense]
MRNHALKNDSMTARLFAEGNRLLDRFFSECRAWVARQLVQPDEENWWAMWYPKNAAQIA